MQWDAAKKVDGNECSSPGVTAYQLVFRDIFSFHHSVYFRFTFYWFSQSYRFHQILQVLVVGRNVGCEWCGVFILFQYLIDHLFVYAELVNIHNGLRSRLLLYYGKDVPIEGILVDSDHVAESLSKIA